MGDSHTIRRISVHQALGGGSLADVLLWRKWGGSVLLLVSSTFLWFLFVRAGHNPLSFVSSVLLLLVIVLFFWAKSANLLNRPLPPIPDLEVSEKSIEQAADVIRVWVNHALSIAHEIAVCGNLRVLVQVAALLWLISFVGSLCSFVTFVYLGFLLALSVPVLYEKYQNQIDDKLCVACRVVENGYRKLDQVVLRKIPVSLYKKKKKSQ
ncbi:hypothetical protein RND81_11G163700 [Saponaria officinalis]|uniref:Reticulon-like protein n=1 Tax=Saponaria officinalis TaxID=3572 RepID=A0AAW1HMX9_SAPOF